MTRRYIARHPMTASRELGGEMIVIFARDSRLFTLNEVGASIWRAADGATPLREIVDRVLCADYDVASATATPDVEAFVEDLLHEGILIASDDPIPLSPEAEAP